MKLNVGNAEEKNQTYLTYLTVSNFEGTNISQSLFSLISFNSLNISRVFVKTVSEFKGN